MKFSMHQRIIGENLIKIGLILSAQWRFSEERYQACPVTLIYIIGRTMHDLNPKTFTHGHHDQRNEMNALLILELFL